MRKGAAGYGEGILSSAIRVTSTFADVAYSKASGKPGAFFVVVVDNLPQSIKLCKSKYVKLSPEHNKMLYSGDFLWISQPFRRLVQVCWPQIPSAVSLFFAW